MNMLLNGIRQDDEFADLHARILVTAPENDFGSGGLYLLDFNRNRWEQLYSGNCRGIARIGDEFYIADNAKGLLKMDCSYRILKNNGITNLDYHGLVPLPDGRHILAVESTRNAVGFYDTADFTRTGEIRLHPSDYDTLHVNDAAADGRYLYVSMFHPDDLWRHYAALPTGCIIRLDLRKISPGQNVTVKPIRHVTVNGLWMPHSVQVLDGELAYCDSMRFQVVIGNTRISFQGVTRGLMARGDFLFIGQSRMRHLSRMLDRSGTHCMLESGLFVYKRKKGISRFIPLPPAQIYQFLDLKR